MMLSVNRCRWIGFLLIAALHADIAASAEKPNVVFILADDLGYGDLGCFGQTQVATPQLDRMAAEGLKFTQHYAGSTVCAPSRCVLMTGKHLGHASVRGNRDVSPTSNQPLPASDVTIAELLHDEGYATALVGKWGLGDEQTVGNPNRQGFDYSFGYLSQSHAHNYYPEYLFRNGEKVRLRNVVPKASPSGAGVASEQVDYSPDLIRDDALGWLEQHHDRPFFLYLALTLPHANDEAGHDGQETPDYGRYADRDWPDAQKGTAAMITRIDDTVGRVRELLDRLGVAENTLVVFTSDNGPHAEGGNDPTFFHSSGPLRGIKRDLYEGGIRVPTLAVWPGHVAPGKTTDMVSGFQDWLPTLAELAGARLCPKTRSTLDSWEGEAPAEPDGAAGTRLGGSLALPIEAEASVPGDVDGLSLVPTLTGKGEQRQHDYLYWEFYERDGKRAIRSGDWKAVQVGLNKSPQPIELYDLSTDPGEQHDVAAGHPDIVARLEQQMNAAHADSKVFSFGSDR